MLTRRSFITGLVAAPAVITTPGLLMPVRKVIMPEESDYAKELRNLIEMLENARPKWERITPESRYPIATHFEFTGKWSPADFRSEVKYCT